MKTEKAQDVTPQPEQAEAAPAGAAVVERLAVEEWARRKKMLPKMVGGATLKIPGELMAHHTVAVRLGVEGATAPSLNPGFSRFEAARVMFRWPEGAELTEKEFDAAVKKATDDNVSR